MSDIILPDDQMWCVGLEGRYAASYSGDIWSYVSGKPNKIKGAVIDDKKKGIKTYRVFALALDGKKVTRYFHRLVAEAWLPNLENKPQINHKDHDKLNNHVSNLEWATPMENVKAMQDYYGKEHLAICRQIKKGFECDQDFINFIKIGDLGGYKTKSTLISKIPESAWQISGVPKEITKVVSRECSLLDSWNYIITVLDEVFDLDNKLVTLEYMFNFNMTLPSHIRSGRRWKKEIKIYNKYRNDPIYTKFYKKTYSVK